MLFSISYRWNVSNFAVLDFQWSYLTTGIMSHKISFLSNLPNPPSRSSFAMPVLSSPPSSNEVKGETYRGETAACVYWETQKTAFQLQFSLHEYPTALSAWFTTQISALKLCQVHCSADWIATGHSWLNLSSLSHSFVGKLKGKRWL